MVKPVEMAFRSRWKLKTLRRVDPDLCQRLEEQINLYEGDLVMGDDRELQESAEAMVRGWEAARRRLELKPEPDDAYFVGYDEHTMTKVIIGPVTASVGRVQRIAGHELVMITPDEVAALVGAYGALKAVKSIFPDAEICGPIERMAAE